MEYYKNRICVTVEDLTRNDDGEAVMTLEAYRHYSKRNYFRVMRRGGGPGCYVLIEFDSLPPKYRARFEDKYGNPEEVLKDKPITEEFVIDSRARDFYRDEWLLPDGSRMTDEQIDEYTYNASVLNELIRLINDRRSTRRAHGGKAVDFWAAVLATSENFRKYPGHTLPEGKSQLQAKINAYKKDGYAAIISGKLGNKNSIKITEEAGNQIIALKRSRVPVYNNAQVFEEFNRIAATRGWKPLKSEKSLVQFLHRPEIEPRWWDAVYGELSAKNRYGRKNKTKMGTMRDTLWYSDGTKINLYYKAYEGAKLVVRTTSVYEVMDAYSEVLLGFHISDTENFDAQYHAFRMAIETYRHRPYEIVNDNQGGHKKLTAIGFLDRITCAVSRRTAPYNPSGKTIESVFGRFQSQILHKDWRFTGQNVTATSQESRPNLEFVEANKEFLYTLPELKEAYAKARQEWNIGLHPHTGRPRLQMYLSSQNAEAKEVNDLDMMELFWLQTAKPVEFNTNGITITVNKKSYTYEVFDAETGLPDLAFRRDNTYRKFVVMYDPLDLTHVRLFSQDKSGLRYVTDAYPYASVARNIQEQKPGDMQFFRTMDSLNKEERIRRQMEAAELENAHGVAPEQHGLNRPKIKGVSAKTVEKVMAAMARPAPQEEVVDVGLAHKIISNKTPLESGSRYDKM